LSHNCSKTHISQVEFFNCQNSYPAAYNIDDDLKAAVALRFL
jgi:hypothetical protein